MESPSARKAPQLRALLDKSSQGDLVMSAYWDAKSHSLRDAASGQLVLGYVFAGSLVAVAAW